MAGELFEAMLQSEMEPDLITYTTLIRGFGNSNNLQRAIELFEALKNGGFPVEEKLYHTVIHSCLRHVDGVTAARLVHELDAIGGTLSPSTWIWVLEVLISKDDEKSARPIVRLIESRGVVLDDYKISRLISTCKQRGGLFLLQSSLKRLIS